MPDSALQGYLDLVDWRRRVGDLYRLAARDGLLAFRAARDDLLRTHPQSPVPLEDRAGFTGIEYFAPDPAARIAGTMAPSPDETEIEIDTGGPDGVIHYRRAGRLEFELGDAACELTVFSLVGYGGGLFLPFRDLTSGKDTYGGGRYLFDTIKNTDGGCLEVTPGSARVVIDLNYAYNPSCAYDHRWACPLAPQENWLKVGVTAGEKVYQSTHVGSADEA